MSEGAIVSVGLLNFPVLYSVLEACVRLRGEETVDVFALNPKPYTSIPEHQTRNPKPETPNPKPQTPNPEP
jgi:hypothetical protein